MSRLLVDAELVSNETVARDTVVLRFAFAEDAGVRAGQFAMVHPGDDEAYVLPRPLSILGAGEGHIDFLVKTVGRGSRALAAMRPGDSARIFAPLGSAFDLSALEATGDVVLVGGGVGVVPLVLLARELVERGTVRPHIVFGARSPADVPMKLIDGAEGDWQLWVEDAATGAMNRGVVTDGLLGFLQAHPTAAVATCGPTPMMKAVARICRDRDLSLQVCLEEQMGCGAGVCRACVVDDAREERRRTVCVDGPVFDVATIRFLDDDARPGVAIAGGTS